jgi:hypothetical protein
MRQTLLTLVSAVTLIAPALDAGAKDARRPRPDLTVAVSGADVAGEAVAITCNLALIAAPSNLFAGACDVAVGGEHVIIGGLTESPEGALAVVLNGQVTIRGSAESGSRRFDPAIHGSAAGFPVRLRVDPLTRRFTLESETPGAGDEPLAAGQLSHGDVVFTVQ